MGSGDQLGPIVETRKCLRGTERLIMRIKDAHEDGCIAISDIENEHHRLIFDHVVVCGAIIICKVHTLRTYPDEPCHRFLYPRRILV